MTLHFRCHEQKERSTRLHTTGLDQVLVLVLLPRITIVIESAVVMSHLRLKNLSVRQGLTAEKSPILGQDLAVTAIEKKRT